MKIPKEPFENFPVLHVNDLVLREIDMNDIDEIEEISYRNGIKTGTREEAIATLEKIMNDYRKREAINWVITREGSRSVLGTCGFYRGFKDGVGEIGYVLKEAHRGKGIMTEVVKAVSRYGFEGLNLCMIKAYTRENNLASIAVLDRAGYVQVDSDLTGYIQFVLNRK